jgi:hypothetical protein
MGNSLDSYTTDLKDYVSKTTVTPKKTSARTPNEAQYDDAAAFSMIAYKNQDPTQHSDLDIAKLNFENNYQKFLILFGQYSNAPLNHYPLKNPQDVLSYPITNKTLLFDKYPMKRPFPE